MAERSEAGALYVPLTAQTGRLRASTPVPRAAAYDQVIAKLRRLPEQAKEDWDSYGGHSVPPAACQQALNFITALLAHLDLDEHPPAPELGPVPEGGVVLRWMTPNYEVELTFLAESGEYTVRERGTADVVAEGEIGRPESLLRDVIKAYVAR